MSSLKIDAMLFPEPVPESGVTKLLLFSGDSSASFELVKALFRSCGSLFQSEAPPFVYKSLPAVWNKKSGSNEYISYGNG